MRIRLQGFSFFRASTICGILLGSVATAATAQEQRSVADSVKAVEATRADIVVRGDTAALSRMVADEFYEVSRLGTLRNKAANIHDLANGDLKLLSVKYDSTMVHVYGDVAILTAISTQNGTYHGFPFTGRIRYTRVFVRRDGRWQAVMMQQTPIQ